MNFQKSHGDFSPNVKGDNNQIGNNSANIKFGIKQKMQYTFLGFLIGVFTSFWGSYFYDNFKKATSVEKCNTETYIVDNDTLNKYMK
jgi:hypothetical protein